MIVKALDPPLNYQRDHDLQKLEKKVQKESEKIF